MNLPQMLAYARPWRWTLVACVVTPGFDFADWRMDGAEDLRARFRGAAAAEAIAALARD